PQPNATQPSAPKTDKLSKTDKKPPTHVAYVPHRPLDSSTLTTYSDVPNPAKEVASGPVPKGTLIRAKLLVPADPMNPGPVLAEVSEEVKVAGKVAIPKGAALACASQAGAGSRVALTCDTITLPGRGSVTFEGTALGSDQRPGLPVGTTGG